MKTSLVFRKQITFLKPKRKALGNYRNRASGDNPVGKLRIEVKPSDGLGISTLGVSGTIYTRLE